MVTTGSGESSLVEPTPVDSAEEVLIAEWVSANYIDAGETWTIEYQAEVEPDVVIGNILTLESDLTWTGIEGSNPNERTGTQTPVENDYRLERTFDVQASDFVLNQFILLMI